MTAWQWTEPDLVYVGGWIDNGDGSRTGAYVKASSLCARDEVSVNRAPGMRRIRRPSQKQYVLWASRTGIRWSTCGISLPPRLLVLAALYLPSQRSNTTPRLWTHETGACCRVLICFFRLTVSDRYLTRRYTIGLPCHRQMRPVSPRGPPPLPDPGSGGGLSPYDMATCLVAEMTRRWLRDNSHAELCGGPPNPSVSQSGLPRATCSRPAIRGASAGT